MNTIKINELKVGDRVKFNISENVRDVNRIKETGIIKNISNINGYLIDCGEINIWINKEDIISKLEPQYKEIFIEKEENPTPKSYKFDYFFTTAYIEDNKAFIKFIPPKWAALGGSYTIEIREKE